VINGGNIHNMNELPQIKTVYTTQLKIALKWLLRHNKFRAKDIKELKSDSDIYELYQIAGYERKVPTIYHVYVHKYPVIKRRS